MDMNLEGKTAIVTGAGAGIGRAVSLQLARRGAAVVLVDRDRAGADETLRQVREAGGDGRVIEADVTRSEDVGRMVENVTAPGATIDCLFNNAGIEGRIAPIWEIDEADFDRVIEVNVKGAFLVLRHVLPVMIRAGGGTVVNTASIAGLGGSPDISPYITSKHAVIGLTRSTAADVGRYGIRVNAVCPGPVATRMMESIDAQRAEIGAPPPNARTYADADDIAGLVVFLLSDLSRNITGASFASDGGRTGQIGLPMLTGG